MSFNPQEPYEVGATIVPFHGYPAGKAGRAQGEPSLTHPPTRAHGLCDFTEDSMCSFLDPTQRGNTVLQKIFMI